MTKPRKGINVRFVVAISLIVAVLAVVIAGVTLLDSPAQERLRRLDERRVDDLRSIFAELDFYWMHERTVPSSLGKTLQINQAYS